MRQLLGVTLLPTAALSLALFTPAKQQQDVSYQQGLTGMLLGSGRYGLSRHNFA